MTKSSLNKRGYNKFLQMDGEVSVSLDQDKIDQDQKWDELKGHVTNSTLDNEELITNYQHLWPIEITLKTNSIKNHTLIRSEEQKKINSVIPPLTQVFQCGSQQTKIFITFSDV